MGRLTSLKSDRMFCEFEFASPATGCRAAAETEELSDGPNRKTRCRGFPFLQGDRSSHMLTTQFWFQGRRNDRMGQVENSDRTTTTAHRRLAQLGPPAVCPVLAGKLRMLTLGR